MTTWVTRWKYVMSEEEMLPGVRKLQDGRFYIRQRVTDPRTGKKRDISKPVATKTAREALFILQKEVQKIKDGVVDEPATQTRFRDFAVSLLERKVQDGEVKSAMTRQKWGVTLEHHLCPAFGDILMDRLSRADIVAWREKVNGRVQAGELSPPTANGWLSILKVIVNTYVADNELDRNPVAKVKTFKRAGFRSYTEEEPNSLLPNEVPGFLVKLKEMYPQHFAMVALGFATGLRPSSLRPLRRRGEHADVLWESGVILVRRSHTVKDEVMEATKTGLDQRIALPKDLMDILRWHEDSLPEGPMADSDLLFPSDIGGFRARSCLDRPFRIVAKELGLRKKITSRAMRRTYQDLARAAQVKDIVVRSVSGHATEAMQHHYSTVSGDEQREGIGRVVALFKLPDDAGERDPIAALPDVQQAS